MKVDRYIIIKRLRDAGVSFVVLAQGFQVSETRVKQIYYKQKSTLSFLASKGSEFTRVMPIYNNGRAEKGEHPAQVG